MQRRSAALIFLLAAIVLAVLPRLSRAAIPGSASPEDLPGPPAVGSCVSVESGVMSTVDCAGVHDGEVVLEWPSGPAGRSALIDPTDCAAMVEPYPIDAAGEELTGDWFARTGWMLVPGAGTPVIVRAPAGQEGTDEDWSVCLLTAGAPYAGRAADPGTDGQLSGAFRSCLSSSNGTVSCARPHWLERLATKWDVLSDAGTGGTTAGRVAKVREQQAESCAQFAAGVTGAADPTRGGRVTVQVVVDATRSYRHPDHPSDLMFEFDAGCVVTSTVPLTVSLVGFGPGPLPYA